MYWLFLCKIEACFHTTSSPYVDGGAYRLKKIMRASFKVLIFTIFYYISCYCRSCYKENGIKYTFYTLPWHALKTVHLTDCGLQDCTNLPSKADSEEKQTEWYYPNETVCIPSWMSCVISNPNAYFSIGDWSSLL